MTWRDYLQIAGSVLLAIGILLMAFAPRDRSK